MAEGAVHKLCLLGSGGGGQKLPILRRHSLWTAPKSEEILVNLEMRGFSFDNYLW